MVDITVWPHTVVARRGWWSHQPPRATPVTLHRKDYALECAYTSALHLDLSKAAVGLWHTSTLQLAGHRSQKSPPPASSILTLSSRGCPCDQGLPLFPFPPDTLAWQVRGGSLIICPPFPARWRRSCIGPSRRTTSACGIASSRAYGMASRENDTDCMRAWRHAVGGMLTTRTRRRRAWKRPCRPPPSRPRRAACRSP